MKKSRARLDQALVERNLAPTRSQARSLVMAGRVRVEGVPASKAGMQVAAGIELEVLAPRRYVSRGGDKLAVALQQTRIDPAGRVCLDVGASTGGFTDCLLQHGAACVVAVDVGYGQIDWRLRRDDRVFLLERTNARYLRRSDLPDALPRSPDLLVLDLSFIGIAKVLPAVGATCSARSDALALVKPQFECGPEQVESGGLVRDAAVRRQAVRSVADAAVRLGWTLVAAVPSPLRGATGNWECFLQLRRPRLVSATPERTVEQIIDGLWVPDDSRGALEADTGAHSDNRQ